MRDHPIRLGRALAWLDGDQWLYTLSVDDAPDVAVAVDRLLVDGRILLHHFTGIGGEFICDSQIYEP